MLNTTRLPPTKLAFRYCALTSAGDAQSAASASRYQARSGPSASGYCSQNSRSVLLAIIRMDHILCSQSVCKSIAPKSSFLDVQKVSFYQVVITKCTSKMAYTWNFSVYHIHEPCLQRNSDYFP